MTPELQDKLLKKYPKFFAQKELPPAMTCLCWGFECKDGWYDLIEEVAKAAEKYNNDNPGIPENDIQAAQIKEKYGCLRIYVNHAPDYIYDLLDKVERKSAKICEDCGQLG